MKIAIAGYGTEGKSNYHYFKDKGVVTIADERDQVTNLPEGVATVLGPGAFSRLDDFDLVLRSPGINPKKIRTNGKIWSATNEFFEKCPAPIIGVTGTKGKGTTCSLIAAILKEDERTVHLVGNIGVPALQELPDIKENDLVVYELSSFQLWDATRSPDVAVVLGIEPDHLDVHDSFDDYLRAKANIAYFQDCQDLIIYHPANIHSQRAANEWRGQCPNSGKRYGIKDDGLAYVEDGYFKVEDVAVCPKEALHLPGRHNIENACAAISAVLRYLRDVGAIERGLRSFHGLDHRLKKIGSVSGVAFYDDSIATTPGSAIAALESFKEPKTIILGGSDKGARYEEVIDACAKTGARVVAIGQTGAEIARLCREKSVSVDELRAATMDDIVRSAYDMSPDGGVVILSPASASFDMFNNYSDRGNQFINAVKRLEERG